MLFNASGVSGGRVVGACEGVGATVAVGVTVLGVFDMFAQLFKANMLTAMTVNVPSVVFFFMFICFPSLTCVFIIP